MVLDAFYLSKKRHRTSYEGRRKWLYKMFLTSALLRRYHRTSKLFSPAKWKTSHYRQTFHCMKKLRNLFKHSQNQGTQSQLKTLYIPFCNQSELWRCFLNMRQCAVLERNLRNEQPTTCSNFENILRQRNEMRPIIAKHVAAARVAEQRKIFENLNYGSERSNKFKCDLYFFMCKWFIKIQIFFDLRMNEMPCSFFMVYVSLRV